MSAGTIDTLRIFDRLKKTFTEEQAHVISEIIKDVHEDNFKVLATKADLKHELKELELRLKYELTLRFGIMLAAAVATLAAIIKL